uniref:Oxoglutarate receptor 1 n=1 Tax=Astyanax mexicanus TaxID=7994 RepID=W5LS00_ASTMX
MEKHFNGSADCYTIDLYIKHHYLPIMYGVIFLVGVVGNLLAFTVYLVKLRPWKSSSIIMVNLVVADLLYTLSLPFLVQFYATMNWTLGEFMCRFLRFCFYFNLYGSILFLTCHSIFRYIAVVHPLKAAQIQRKRWGITVCLAVWAISLVEIGPMLSMITTKKKGNTTVCLDFASNDPNVIWWYGWILTVLGYLVPLVVVCFCYNRIGNTLGISLSAKRPSRLRTQKLTVMILVVFIVCFLPYHILRVMRVHSLRSNTTSCLYRRGVNAAYTLSRPLAGLNIVFNLALYTLSGDKFQQAFYITMEPFEEVQLAPSLNLLIRLIWNQPSPSATHVVDSYLP